MPPFMVATDWVFVGVFLFALAKSKTQQEKALALFVGVGVLVHQVEEAFRVLGINNWFVDYVYPVPQIILTAYALGAPLKELTGIGAMLTVGMLATLLHGPVTSPETVVQAMGAGWVCCTAVQSDDRMLSLFALAYWGLTLPVLVLSPMAFAPPWDTFALLLQIVRALQIVGLVVLVAWFARR